MLRECIVNSYKSGRRERIHRMTTRPTTVLASGGSCSVHITSDGAEITWHQSNLFAASCVNYSKLGVQKKRKTLPCSAVKPMTKIHAPMQATLE